MTPEWKRWTGAARSVKIEDEVARRKIMLRGKGSERVGPCPICDGEDRFSINIKKGVWNCRGCRKGGDVIALVKHLDGVDFQTACMTLTDEPPPKANGKDDHFVEAEKVVVAKFEYFNEDGALVFVVERASSTSAPMAASSPTRTVSARKRFGRSGPIPIGPAEWHWNVEGVPPIPYRLPELVKARDIIRRLLQHVVCSYDDALAVALWIMFAWVHEAAATHSPILLITSAQPESGKSTTLGLIKFLARRCMASVEISEAALYRAIQLWQPSFAIDEFDAVLVGDDKAGLRSVINSGHTRGQGVIRCVEPDFTPQQFETFCPKALGMVGRKLPDATLSRSIVVELRRRKPSERIVKFDHRDDAELAQLRSRLDRWAADNGDALRNADPSMPSGFDNRRADNWRVMFAIADGAGEGWGDKARAAASHLELASNTTSIDVQLLADIKRIFDEEGCDCMLSAHLVSRLKEDEEGPWAAWGKGKGLTQNSLATRLSGGGGRGRGSRGGFGIRSETVHPSRDVHGRGYKRSAFEDVWARYLPPEATENTPTLPLPSCGCADADEMGPSCKNRCARRVRFAHPIRVTYAHSMLVRTLAHPINRTGWHVGPREPAAGFCDWAPLTG